MGIDFATTSTISNPSSTLLGISNAGHITKPLQPIFNAFGIAATTQGNNVVLSNVAFNVGNCYNSVNGAFTAPVSGIYYFYFNHINSAIAGEYRIVFYKNNVWYSGSNYINYVPAAYFSLYASQHINLAANDFVTVRLDLSPAALYSGAGDLQYGQFSGHLIG
jgi:hypothetical protein